MGGAHTTRIANGYREHIRGKVTVNRDLYRRMVREGGGKLSVGVLGVKMRGKREQDHKSLVQLPGFVKIASGKFLAFGLSGEDGRVFVSISAGGDTIAENFPVRNGHGVIVDADGDLKNAKPGKIWRDTEGKSHSIAQNQNLSVHEVLLRDERRRSAEYPFAYSEWPLPEIKILQKSIPLEGGRQKEDNWKTGDDDKEASVREGISSTEPAQSICVELNTKTRCCSKGEECTCITDVPNKIIIEEDGLKEGDGIYISSIGEFVERLEID